MFSPCPPACLPAGHGVEGWAAEAGGGQVGIRRHQSRAAPQPLLPLPPLREAACRVPPCSAVTPACTLCLPQSCRHTSLPRLPLIHAPAPLPCLQIQRSREGKRVGRLYVTDGSMPDYVVQQYPRSAPGAVLCSAVRGAGRGGAGGAMPACSQAPNTPVDTLVCGTLHFKQWVHVSLCLPAH